MSSPLKITINLYAECEEQGIATDFSVTHTMPYDPEGLPEEFVPVFLSQVFEGASDKAALLRPSMTEYRKKSDPTAKDANLDKAEAMLSRLEGLFTMANGLRHGTTAPSRPRSFFEEIMRQAEDERRQAHREQGHYAPPGAETPAPETLHESYEGIFGSADLGLDFSVTESGHDSDES